MNDKPALGLHRKRGLGWRRGAPTPKQRDYLVLHGLTPDYGDETNWPITAGEANEMIHKHWVEQQGKPPEERDEAEEEHSNDFVVEPVRFRELDFDIEDFD